MNYEELRCNRCGNVLKDGEPRTFEQLGKQFIGGFVVPDMEMVWTRFIHRWCPRCKKRFAIAVEEIHLEAIDGLSAK